VVILCRIGCPVNVSELLTVFFFKTITDVNILANRNVISFWGTKERGKGFDCSRNMYGRQGIDSHRAGGRGGGGGENCCTKLALTCAN
jgi:hypothetical protein